jgi:hypothetical protein
VSSSKNAMEDQLDRTVRWHVYEVTMREGAPPPFRRLCELAGEDADVVAQSLRRLASERMLVLQPESDEILMAGPFSAVPTPFRVTTSQFRGYGNCIWDALGIAAMLQCDVRIDTSCGDCGVAARIDVRDGNVVGEGLMHFALPARIWWQDIVFT